MENPPSFSSLLCHEDLSNIDDKGMEETFQVTQDDDEYMKVLLDKEINKCGLEMEESSNFIIENWIKELRPDAVQYILNTVVKFGFKVQTACLAITYLDTFLSRNPFESDEPWLVPLSAMACLLLAVKMEECSVPALSTFPRDYYDFENERILRMEILVLRKLAWRMQKLTPFAFTQYFLSRFGQNSSVKGITSRIEEIILVAIQDEKMMHHNRTSTMAAAATLLIIDPRLTKETLEFKINALSLGGYLQSEDVFSLYNQMKELDMGKNKSSITESPLLSPVQTHRIRVTEYSSVSSTRSGKRKSLTFSEQCDQSSRGRHPKRPL